MVGKDEKNIIKVGRYFVDITRVMSGRVIKARDDFNNLEKGKSNIESTKDLLDIFFTLIQIDFSIKHFFDWLKRKLISKRYVLNNLTYDELNNLVEKVILVNLYGEDYVNKKKEKMTLQRMAVIAAENLTDEQLKKLLLKSQL